MTGRLHEIVSSDMMTMAQTTAFVHGECVVPEEVYGLGMALCRKPVASPTSIRCTPYTLFCHTHLNEHEEEGS